MICLLDLDAIRDWGAAAVVTLVEPKELTLLRVEYLGEEVRRRRMLWFHLPIVDVSTPTRNSSGNGKSLVTSFARCYEADAMSWFIAAAGLDEPVRSELGF